MFNRKPLERDMELRDIITEFSQSLIKKALLRQKALIGESVKNNVIPYTIGDAIDRASD